MIQNVHESDFAEFFQARPVYIGDCQGGEMLFSKAYDDGLVLTVYLDIYGEKIELAVLYAEQNMTVFSLHVERIEIEPNAIHFIRQDKRLAELQLEPHLFFKVYGCQI